MCPQSASTALKNTPARVAPRAALVGLEPATDATLRDCFRQFGIDTVSMSSDEAIPRIAHEKMEACVVRLDESATSVLTAVRSSPSNHRMVVYGVCASTQQAMKFSRFGVNAMINDPVERQNVLRVVRATHLLVAHELRRYVRIPIVGEITLNYAGVRTRAIMQEVSGGGLSLESSLSLSSGEACEVTMHLPNLPSLTLACRVAWLRPAQKLIGLRFESQEPNRFRIKNWIDDYLDQE